jgi:hypothetical protein
MMRIRIQLITLMRMRIRKLPFNLVRIHANPDPKPCPPAGLDTDQLSTAERHILTSFPSSMTDFISVPRALPESKENFF